ncbi:unnamed protein product [Schistocephalus solidus]|uniref:Reverse transcriptase domain-containing protein n=1 Tax=Schistocephalus solidus TaxID=70667 RepID=A0A183TS66_SCHSO|nr:unnamed protein product [Schistocephalus solidus]
MCGIPSPADQHLLPPSDAGEGHVDAPSVTALAAAGLCSRPEARSIGRAGNQGDLRCQCLDISQMRLRLQPDEGPKKSKILKRWAEHFISALNCSSAISDAAIDRLIQVDTNNDLDLPASLSETIRAVQQISSGKAPGSDAIIPQFYKHGQVPQDFKDATIVYLYKTKGNPQLCDNHRGISLLNIAGKNFAHIFLIRLNGHLEQGLLPESQCGFRRHRGTTDMIFAALQLQEKCQEMRTHLYITFMDLTKAFDKVHRDGMWKVMHSWHIFE